MRNESNAGRSLESSSIHEAGHAVVAMALGVEAVRVEVNRAPHPSGRGHFFEGSTYFFGTLLNAKKFDRAVIAYSGAVAELINAGEESEDIDFTMKLVFGDEADLAPSKSDWEGVHSLHRTCSSRSLKLAEKILRAKWGRVEYVASKLREHYANWGVCTGSANFVVRADQEVIDVD